MTLTYSPECLPGDLSVNIHHFQDFIRSLRKRLAPKRIRYFHCGEYGEECALCGLSRKDCRCYQFQKSFGRPHYHAIIFGFGFPDRRYFKTVNGCQYFTSVFLDDVWDRGFCVIGNVSFESCAYVARYVTKKITGDAAHDHYFKLDSLTGELFPILPEYASMSLKPGIGASWFEKFGREVTHSDSVVMRGLEMKPPRFYEQFYDELELECDKFGRESEARKRDFENTPERLRDREVCKEAQVSFLKRGLDYEAQSF